MSNSSVTKSLRKVTSKNLKEIVDLLEWYDSKKEDDIKLSTIQILFALIDNIRKCVYNLEKVIQPCANCLKYDPKNTDEKSSLNYDENVLFLIKLIINNLENKNPEDQHGHSFLHVAARGGYPEECQFIIENIEDKNPSDKYGNTPLHEAARYGQFSVCQLLIKNTKNLNSLDSIKRTPLELAEENGYEEICNLIKSAIKEQNGNERVLKRRRRN